MNLDDLHRAQLAARHMEQRTTVNSEDLGTMSKQAHIGPDATLWHKDRVAFIMDAMGALALEHRAVLILRCLEGQSYAQIAVIFGGSQMRAQMLFYRAKAALMRQLVSRGLSRSHFQGALTVFGALTRA